MMQTLLTLVGAELQEDTVLIHVARPIQTLFEEHRVESTHL